MGNPSPALDLHARLRGKFSVTPTTEVTLESLAQLYTPGVAEVSRAIEKDPAAAYRYTRKWNLVAIVSDGTRVLGLGNVGPEAALPVMEGKAIIFKQFGDVDALPICVKTSTADELVTLVKQLEPTFGAINLEDIETPKVFEVEERLRRELSIPVFHDDQYGTGVVVLAGLLNAARVVDKSFSSLRVVIGGAGAAGIGVAKLLVEAGASDVVLCDSRGAVYAGRDHLDPFKQKIAAVTNLQKRAGSLEEVLRDADAFIGLTGKPGLLTPELLQTMASKPIVFALTNPEPEILPEAALKAGAAVVGTGRSDFPNQVNNSLAFPGILRGVLDSGARSIEIPALVRAARAIAGLVEPTAKRVVPPMSDTRVAPAVAQAVRG